MGRRQDPGQFDLFADQPVQVAAASPERTVPAGFGGQPDSVVEVLDEIVDQRFGLVDVTERVVRVDGDRRCRHADDDQAAIVESLVAQRYAVAGEFTMQRHGAILKRVYLVKLTTAGEKLRRRWSHLAGAR